MEPAPDPAAGGGAVTPRMDLLPIPRPQRRFGGRRG